MLTQQPIAPPVAKTWRARLWLVVPIVAFFVYLHSFSDRPVLLSEIDRLADTDAADHARLITEFDLSRVWGDEWNFDSRTPGDRVQKHKLHHVLYHLLGAGAYRTFAAILRPLGISPVYALYAWPALLGVLNLLLLHWILGRLYPNSSARPVYLVLAGFALAPWIFSSITESWTLSTTFVLAFVAHWLKAPEKVWVRSALLGIAMLNNVSLLALHVFTGVHAFATRRDRWVRFVVPSAAAGALSLAVWFAALGVLSIFDPDFAPANMLAFGQFFRAQVQPDIPVLSFYYAKSILTNQFVNSVVSLQADPFVPQDALLRTFRYSWVGTVAVLAYVGVLGAAVGGVIRVWRPRVTGGLKQAVDNVAADPTTAIAGYALALLAVNLYVCAYAGFVYSGVMVPLVVMLLFRYLEPLPKRVRLACYAVVGLIVIVNALQIRLFREALLLPHGLAL